MRSGGAPEPITLHGVRLYGEQPVDMRVRDSRIEAVGSSIDAAGSRSVDCAGLIALPGFVDLHTHLREPGPTGAENIESGTRAAVAGGYTAVFAMANTYPVTDTADAVDAVARRAREVASCDVFPVGAVTTGLAGRAIAPLEEMAATGAAVRVFSDDGRCVGDSALMREALGRIGRVGGVLAQHAQCPQLAPDGQANEGAVALTLGVPPWPGVAEDVIIARDIVLAAEPAAQGARLHVCHVSTEGAVELLRWAKQRGLPVTAEVTPHHLALVDTVCLGADTRFKVNPPLRTEADRAAVRRALADGFIDVVATDHAPHGAETKNRRWCDAPPGMLGLETALGIVVEYMVKTGLLDWRALAKVMSQRPAEIGGIAGRHGGRLAVSEPATLCLVDPDHSWSVSANEMNSLSANTPFEGMRLSAKVVATLIRGQVAYDGVGLFGGSV